MNNELTNEDRERIDKSQDDLFRTVSRADKNRVNDAANIVSSEINEWLRHKPYVTQIIKLVQENPTLFMLSTDDDALRAAHDYLKAVIKRRQEANRHAKPYRGGSKNK